MIEHCDHPMKVCSSCGQLKSISAFYVSGTSRCKVCHNKYSRKYYKQHAAKRKAQMRQYQTDHADELRERGKARYLRNKAKRIAYARTYLKEHPEVGRKAGQQWYRKNKTQVLTRTKQWAIDHPQQARKYRRAWVRNHRDRARANWAKRRARKANAPIMETIDRKYIFSRDRGICHLCKRKVDPKNWHLDHLTPLSKGGEHSHRNVAVACPRCNLRKGPGRLRSQTRLCG